MARYVHFLCCHPNRDCASNPPLCLPRASAARPATQRAQVRLEPHEVRIFIILAAIITIGSAILSMMGTLLLPLLQARGLDLSMAVGIGMIVGPSQVGARLVEMLAGRRYSPIWTMVASVVLVAVAAAMLLAGFPLVAITIALYGAGNGIGSIARGTVPLALFGPERFPVLMGRLALPLMIAMAVSPFIGGLAFQYGGASWTLVLLAALALTNVFLMVAFWAQLPEGLRRAPVTERVLTTPPRSAVTPPRSTRWNPPLASRNNRNRPLLIAKCQLKRVLPADNPHNVEQHYQDKDQQKQRDQLFPWHCCLRTSKARHGIR